MDILVALAISFCLLIFSVLKNIFIGYTVTICLILFAAISLKKDYTIKEILKMSYEGGKKSFVVLRIFILIGAVISIWMASGTIPTIVYYCLKYISPSTFILSAFLISSMTSFLIGTSLGTVSTVGIPLIIIARSGNVNLSMTAGAVIAGAYFGDRCSPMSSSAALVANLTKTNIFTNVKNMLYSSIIPFILSVAFYYLLSINYPLRIVSSNLSFELLKSFKIEFIMLLPAIVILILSLLKIRIHFSMSISILTAFILAVVFQHYALKQIFYYIVFGYKLSNGPLQSIIKGGGIVSMLKTCFVVFVSCSLSGIFEGIKMFDRLKNWILSMKLKQYKLFAATSLTSIVTAAFGCTQTIAVIMTCEIMKDCYENIDSSRFALDIENSAILISALIPWNIAAFVPTTAMNVSTAGYIPFAFYLYIFSIIYFIYHKYSKKDVCNGIEQHA